MAKASSRKKSTWNGFFNYALSDEERAGIRKLVDGKQAPEVGKYVLEMLEQNYKLSITFNESASVFVCSCTGKAGNLNEGWTFTLSHVQFDVAVMGVWFVCSTIFDWGEWPVEENNAVDW